MHATSTQQSDYACTCYVRHARCFWWFLSLYVRKYTHHTPCPFFLCLLPNPHCLPPYQAHARVEGSSSPRVSCVYPRACVCARACHVCVCMRRVCVCVCVSLGVFACVCTCANLRVCVCVCVSARACVRLRVWVCVRKCHVSACMHVCGCVSRSVCVRSCECLRPPLVSTIF